jgi:hypothetical protein
VQVAAPCAPRSAEVPSERIRSRLGTDFSLVGLQNGLSMSLSQQRKIHQSENGDTWWLCRDAKGVFVLHEANTPAGGNVTKTELADFLVNNGGTPEHRALLKMIGSLTELLS